MHPHNPRFRFKRLLTFQIISSSSFETKGHAQGKIGIFYFVIKQIYLQTLSATEPQKRGYNEKSCDYSLDDHVFRSDVCGNGG